jgi:non-ribosomal peptide synthetase component F
MGREGWTSGDQWTIPQLLERRLATDPDSEYLDVCGVKFTAAEVNDTACRIANGLAGLGVLQGDRVATLLENSPEAMLARWGSIRGGAAPEPRRPGPEARPPCRGCDPGDLGRREVGDSGREALNL